jgi:hypothetical protein
MTPCASLLTAEELLRRASDTVELGCIEIGIHLHGVDQSQSLGYQGQSLFGVPASPYASAKNPRKNVWNSLIPVTRAAAIP